MGAVSVLKTDIKIQKLPNTNIQKLRPNNLEKGVRAELSTNITSSLPDASSRHPRYQPCNSSRKGDTNPAYGACEEGNS